MTQFKLQHFCAACGKKVKRKKCADDGTLFFCSPKCFTSYCFSHSVPKQHVIFTVNGRISKEKKNEQKMPKFPERKK